MLNRYKYYGLKIISLWAIYSPVILGILSMMLVVYGGLSFLFIFDRLSWLLADPTILLNGQWTSWLNSYLKGNINYNLLLNLELLIFGFGLGLFLISFIQLVRGIVKKQDIVQQGIYKYIRHPQNLAIIIMVFPLSLYIPGFGDFGIRLADLISWVQFSLLVIVYSDWEERRLKKKYPEQFSQYYESTGFMFPKVFSIKIFSQFSQFKNPTKRYFLLFLIYVASVAYIYYFYLNYPTVQWM